MKKFLAAMLAAMMVVSAFAFAGCTNTETPADDVVNNDVVENQDDASVEADQTVTDENADAGELIVLTNAAFPPFEYMEGDKVVGVDMDIAQAIADELGKTLVIKNVEFDTIIGSIKAGKADMGAAGITVTDERKLEVDFSEKYVTSKQYIILPEDSEVTTVEELEGMKIGVQTGTTGDLILADEIGVEGGCLYGTGAELLNYDNALDATVAMQAGKINAVVIDELPAKSIVAVNEGLKTIELVYIDGSNTEEEYALCVAKGNTELLEAANKVIKALAEEGKIEEFLINHTSKSAVTE